MDVMLMPWTPVTDVPPLLVTDARLVGSTQKKVLRKARRNFRPLAKYMKKLIELLVFTELTLYNTCLYLTKG